MNTSFKQQLVLLGDIAILYTCLVVTLFLRYGTVNAYLWKAHAGPFAIVFALWIIIFFITGLYDLKNFKNTLELVNQVIIAVFAGSILAITLFYLVPYFKISPKTNLAIFIVILTFAEIIWRWLFNSWTKKPQKRVVIIGSGDEIKELTTFIKENPQIGYDIRLHIQEASPETTKTLYETIKSENIDTIIVSETIKDNDSFIREMYQNVLCGIEVLGAMHTYEQILQKLSIAHTEQLWVLTNITKRQRTYELIKNLTESTFATLLLIVLFPLMTVLGLLVKLSSTGPVIYKQIRFGKNEKPFFIYKFRTMHESAEKDGPQWSTRNDKRVTTLGRFLRASHLDELPQLVNVLLGNLSFVGPRPERPEFVKDLKTQIPYYDIRHIVKPGITGWAQINYRYGASTEDAYRKLQYDLFYIKNRSLVLDFLIVLKTIKLFFTTVE